jgi:DNA-binding transcriptional ArsR family regulator
MSETRRKEVEAAAEKMSRQLAVNAVLFAALGDETRLLLLARLAGGGARSIAQLCEEAQAGSARLSRQAVTKHLRVLERARVVHGGRKGRERLYAFDPQRVEGMMAYLEMVSGHWERALGRLREMVEDEVE